MRTIKVRTADSDVIAILVGGFFDLISSADIWVAFGTGKRTSDSTASTPNGAVLGNREHEHYQCFMHRVAATPHQHSEVGARSQHGRPFEHLHTDSDHFQKIERLTVVHYDKTSVLSSANEAREELFCRKNRSIDNIPPTQNALLQRAVYQAGIWMTCSCKYNQNKLNN